MVIPLTLAGCEIDNYEAPQLTLQGNIIDSETGVLVPSGGINAGSVVKFYEGSSSQPLIYNTFPDGTFRNTKVFPATYSYVAEGPFKMLNTDNTIAVDGNTTMEIAVIPHLRLAATLTSSDASSAIVTVAFEKLATDQKLLNLAVIWSKSPNPNNFTFAGGNIAEEDVEALDLTAGERTFAVSDLQPKTKYYIRASGRTANPGNFYNYSTQIEFETP